MPTDESRASEFADDDVGSDLDHSRGESRGLKIHSSPFTRSDIAVFAVVMSLTFVLLQLALNKRNSDLFLVALVVPAVAGCLILIVSRVRGGVVTVRRQKLVAHELFQDMVGMASNSMYADIFGMMGFMNVAFAAIMVTTRLLYVDLPLASIVAAVLVVLFMGVVVLLIWGFLSLATSSRLDARRRVPELAAYLVAAKAVADRPDTGLGTEHIRAIRRMARDEASMADWRLGAIAVGMIQLVSIAWLMMQWMRSQGMLQFGERRDGPSFTEDFGIERWQLLSPDSPSGFVMGAIAAAVATLIIVYLFIKWVVSSIAYLSRESATRIVIQACSEALFQLEEVEATGDEAVQMKRILRRLGFVLIRAEEASRWQQLKRRYVVVVDGEAWLAVKIPPRQL